MKVAECHMIDPNGKRKTENGKWKQHFGQLLDTPQVRGIPRAKPQTLLTSAARCTKSSRQIVTKLRKRRSRPNLVLCARVAHCRPKLRLTKPTNGKRIMAATTKIIQPRGLKKRLISRIKAAVKVLLWPTLVTG